MLNALCRRQADGSWLQARRHPGRVWFEVDVPAGQPSKWLTLYGTRVLAWWDTAQAEGAGLSRRSKDLNGVGVSAIGSLPIGI